MCNFNIVLILVLVMTSWSLDIEKTEGKISVRKNYGWGRNLNGVLGVGDTGEHLLPVEVGVGTTFRDVETPFKKIWSCSQRSFLQAGGENSGVYVYGFGSDHSCGLGCADRSLNTFSSPKLIEGLSSQSDQAVSIRCLSDHTLVLTENGNLFGFGSNKDYALGVKNIVISKHENIHDNNLVEEESCCAECCSTTTTTTKDNDSQKNNNNNNKPRLEKTVINDVGYICEPYLLRNENDVMDISTGFCHSLYLRNDGIVFGAGCNLHFELGISPNKTLSKFVQIPFYDRDTPPVISHISSGPHYSVFVSESGDLYFTGEIVCESFTHAIVSNRTKLLISHEEIGARIMSVSSGDSHFIGRLSNGSYYVFGCDDYHIIDQNNTLYHHKTFRVYDTSKIVNTDSDEITRMLASDCCTAVLTKKGNVWYLGKYGSGDDIYSDFTRIHVGNEKIVDIDISPDHFMAISASGEIFCMGENYVFQCGIIPRFPHTNYRSYQSNVFTEDDVFELKIANGHSFGITASDGNVYSFGDNSYGQLGTGPFIDYYLPYPVFEDEEARKFVVGGDLNFQVTIFLVETGELYVVGNGRYGCLGLGDTQTRYIPEKIDLEYFGGHHVTQVKAGHNHVHAVTKDRKMYSWGLGFNGQLGLGNHAGHDKTDDIVLTPTLNDLIPGEVEMFSVGYESVVVVTNKNRVFQWGRISKGINETFIPEVVNCNYSSTTTLENNDNDNILFCGGTVSLVVGGTTFIMIDVELGYPNNVSYELYWWGSIGEDELVETPTLKYTHTNRFVQCVATNHIICIDEFGDAYGMGDNSFNQANPNKKDADYIYNFEKIELESLDVEISKVSRSSVSDFSTILQEYVSCFGNMDSDYRVCNGHGKCLKKDTCRCYGGYGGVKCNNFSCVSRELNVTKNCDGHGMCFNPNQCKCDDGWGNYPQDSKHGIAEVYGFCKYYHCLIGDRGKLCSGNGHCDYVLGKPRCVCDFGYRGLDCSLPICNGYNGTDLKHDGCGKQSSCISYNQCNCNLQGLNVLLPVKQGEGSEGCIFSVAKSFVYIGIFFLITFVLCICYSCEITCIGCACCNSLCAWVTFRERKKSKEIEGNLRSITLNRERVEKFHNYQSPFYAFLSDESGMKDNKEEEEEEEGEEEEEKKIGLLEPKKRRGKASMLDRLSWADDIEVVLGEKHIFRGKPDGEGMIFYVEKNENNGTKIDLFVVYKGRFVNGKKEGYGVEYKVHQEKEPVKKIFHRNPVNFRFAGHFKNDLRDGKGTEYHDHGKTLVGEYVRGMLLRILSIDYPLEKINLRKDIIYEERAKELGRGGFSYVLPGKLRKDGRDCAVKFFKDVWELEVKGKNLKKSKEGSDSNNESVLYKFGNNYFEQKIRDLEFRRFRSTMSDGLKVLSMFHHPHIIQIYGWSGHTKSIEDFGYVMEKCVESVQQRYFAKKGNLSMTEVRDYIYQTALGMSHVHHVMGVIHRDLKWGNVLIDHFDQIRICDFDMSDRDEMDISGRLNFSEVKGSPFHIAPEVLETQLFDSKCDVYSFGIMIYELLFSKMDDPFEIIESNVCNVCGRSLFLEETKENNHKTSTILNNSTSTWSRIAFFMKDHHSSCGIRPRLEGNKKNKRGAEKWIIELMVKCWRSDPKQRPSFKEICETFKTHYGTEKNGKKYEDEDEEEENLDLNDEKKSIMSADYESYQSIN